MCRFLAQAIKLSTDAAMHRSHQMSSRLCWVNLPLLRFIEISAQCCWLTKTKRMTKRVKHTKMKLLYWRLCAVDLIKAVGRHRISSIQLSDCATTMWLMNHLRLAYSRSTEFHFIFPINCIKFSFFITSARWVELCNESRTIFMGRISIFAFVGRLKRLMECHETESAQDTSSAR